MSQNASAVIELMGRLTDAKRHPLVADCDDWDAISQALVEWGDLAGRSPRHYELCMPSLRVLVETVYCMGHERGKREAREPMPEWVLGEGGKA